MDHAPEQKERGEAVMDLKELMARQREIYDRKIADYGNSFHLTVERFGPVAALTRISDKMERMKVLQGTSAQTRDEVLRDTVSDALNYLLMFSAALILLNWRLDEGSQVEGEAEDVTLVHRLMDNIARDEILTEEKVDAISLFEIWDSLCDTMMEAVREDDMKKIDDILIVNNYLSGLMALYLLRLA